MGPVSSCHPSAWPTAPTDLFDENAVLFAMTLHDGSITCDHHADEDADGCMNTKEPSFGLDPLNPWDFYSVPVPALFATSEPRGVVRDNVIASADAEAVFAYFKRNARVGTLEYEADLNNNATKDGIEYDRSFVGPAMSGPPDGVITVRDAQLAFAQFVRGYRC